MCQEIRYGPAGQGWQADGSKTAATARGACLPVSPNYHPALGKQQRCSTGVSGSWRGDRRGGGVSVGFVRIPANATGNPAPKCLSASCQVRRTEEKRRRERRHLFHGRGPSEARSRARQRLDPAGRGPPSVTCGRLHYCSIPTAATTPEPSSKYRRNACSAARSPS